MTQATPIEVMYQQWEAAYDASTANQELSHYPANTDKKRRENITFERGDRFSTERAAHLELAILYQPPETMRDVQILILLAAGITDGIDPEWEGYRAAMDAVERGLESVLAFISDQLGQPLGRLAMQAIGISRENVAARLAVSEVSREAA